MKTSEKLLQKLKTQFPKECSHLTNLYRCYSINDGVGFCWSSYGKGSVTVSSYDTMTECLKKELILEPASLKNGYVYGYGYVSYIVGVVD
jgi:hypothetical protein